MIARPAPTGILLFILLTGLGLAAWGAPAAEELHYRVSYRGIFSAGTKLPIAEVVIRTRQPSGDSPYAETELSASSSAFSYVESLYPIRYRFRSWYWHDRSGTLASEYFEYGRPDDIEHKLFYLDRAGRPFVTHDLRGGEKVADLALLRDGSYRTPGSGGRQIFDRLGLLQRIRALDLKPGSRFEMDVSNGKRMLRYRVSVEQVERLEVAGREWRALKLRFDGLKEDRHGNQRHAHRPVFIWLSRDAGHIPLKAVSRHTLGRFQLELVPSPAPKRVAARGG